LVITIFCSFQYFLERKPGNMDVLVRAVDGEEAADGFEETDKDV